MDNKIFINKTFTKALESYLNSKNNVKGVTFNSFLVVIIRLLVMIYDELDIINPYDFFDEKMLYNNLTKYGYPKEKIDLFMKKIESFGYSEQKDEFIDIQKMLIDMMMNKKKTINISQQELDSFRNTLYSNESQNPLLISYNYMMTNSSNEILEYFDKNAPLNEKTVKHKQTKKLNLNAYEVLKYSLEDIDNMSPEELEETNKKVYNFFEVNENSINSDYLLDKAVNEYNKPNLLATNGGFVNTLLFIAVICTVAMIIAIVTFILL